jgi:acetyltransferase-like isoleucine patch superfamily enzyme
MTSEGDMVSHLASAKSGVRYGLVRACGALLEELLRTILRGVRTLVSQRRIYVGHRTKISWNVQCLGTGELVLGNNVSVASNTIFRCSAGARIEVGSHTRIGRNCILLAMPGQVLAIGERVEIGDCISMRSVAGITIGNDSRVQDHVEISPRENVGNGRLRVGRRVSISAYSNLDLCADITIEDEVAISPFCSIYTHNHVATADSLIWNNEKKISSILIGYGTWVGHGASIMPGVKIGPYSVIGALSVVTKPFGANMIIGGVPAKIIRYTSIAP